MVGLSYVPQGVSKRLQREYYFMSKLGQGAFGTVYLVEDNSDDWYAMKIIEHKPDGDTYREISVMKTLQHPNVVALLDFSQNGTHVNLVMDYMAGGSLKECLDRKGRLTEATARLYFLQMCKAVEYLHSRRVTHHDLKPDNILLNTRKEKTLLKISDFGISKQQVEYYSYSNCGTELYMAPEYWTARHHNYKVDIWALGVILYYCLSSFLPFESQHEICTQRCSFNYDIWDYVSYEPIKVIKRLLTRNYHYRPNIHFPLYSAWLQDRGVLQTYNKLIN